MSYVVLDIAECTTVLISQASKVMLKILQARLQQYMNRELPDVQDGFRKSKKVPPKTSTSALLTKPKPLTMWLTTNCGKFLKRWNTRPPDLLFEKSVWRSGSNS